MKKPAWIDEFFPGIDLWVALSIFVLCILAGLWIGHYAAATEKPLVPTDLEVANLGIKYRDVQLAQVGYSQAQAAFQKTVDDFNTEVEAIKKAHKWPADVQLDKDLIPKREFRFVKPAAPAPGKKP